MQPRLLEDVRQADEGFDASERSHIFPDRERHRAVPVAVGGQATQIRKHPPGEEGFLALVGLDASAETVSPRS
ncbi:MAG: hypothetical protein KatS3mg070_2299 [Meiothermus sp.]|uniref:hypothetical protein n=1 Tax=Meiothermus sp. TaxID=1955249 RepID=UPI0021DE4FDD|nr:hypothetical protein [Meiothermus sp.]GIW28936.1 MAG: hypothetical protein KatS3mg070_2299 [Meiothermus sp.]GIW31531.1 MAG: hypothetical protein KatS3mg071_1705 [Meiothermus sp.]